MFGYKPRLDFADVEFTAPVVGPDPYLQRSCLAKIPPSFLFPSAYSVIPQLSWFLQWSWIRQVLPRYELQEPAEALPIYMSSFCTSLVGRTCWLCFGLASRVTGLIKLEHSERQTHAKI